MRWREGEGERLTVRAETGQAGLAREKKELGRVRFGPKGVLGFLIEFLISKIDLIHLGFRK